MTEPAWASAAGKTRTSSHRSKNDPQGHFDFSPPRATLRKPLDHQITAMKPLRHIASTLCLLSSLFACARASAVTEIHTAAQINSDPKFIRSVADGRETVTGMCIDAGSSTTGH